MRILMFFPGRVDTLPPAMTAAACMSEWGAEVHFLAAAGMEPSIRYLKDHGVIVHLAACQPPSSRLGRAWIRARLAADLFQGVRRWKPDVLWYHGPFAMEYGLLPGVSARAVVAHAYELCDRSPVLHRIQLRVLRRAEFVVVPEINRLWILKAQSLSRAKFLLIPNRPLDDMLPTASGPPTTLQVFRSSGGSYDCRRFVIYQGAFMPERALDNVIAAFQQIEARDVGLLLVGYVGDNSYLRSLRIAASGDRRVAFVPRIPAPDHLKVTAGCDVGILNYSPTKLNNIFCAPNKIYEYAALGLSMILPGFPALCQLNDRYQLGVTCDPESPVDIAQGIRILLTRPAAQVRENAQRFLLGSPSARTLYRDLATLLERAVGPSPTVRDGTPVLPG